MKRPQTLKSLKHFYKLQSASPESLINYKFREESYIPNYLWAEVDRHNKTT